MGESMKRRHPVVPWWAYGWLSWDENWIDRFEAKGPIARAIEWRWRRFLYFWIGGLARRWEAFVLKIEHRQRWTFRCSCGKQLELDIEIVDPSKQLAWEHERITAAGWVPDTWPESSLKCRPMWSCSVACLTNNVLGRLQHAYDNHRLHLELNLEHLHKIEPKLAAEVYARLMNRGEWPTADGYGLRYEDLVASNFGRFGGYDEYLAWRKLHPLPVFADAVPKRLRVKGGGR